jgi:hypothetical protein
MGAQFSTALKRCNRCLVPETHETLVLDALGVCNECRAQEVKAEINRSDQLEQLDALVVECQAGAAAVAAGTFFCQRDQNPMQCRSHIRNAGLPIRLEV